MAPGSLIRRARLVAAILRTREGVTNLSLRNITLTIVTDQAPNSGIGVYADQLAILIRPIFGNLRLLSMRYLAAEEPPLWIRPPNLQYARNLAAIPFVARHNNKALLSSLSPDEPVHFCGTSFTPTRHLKRAIVTVHDYYPRRVALTNLSDPVAILRDLSALESFVTLRRKIQGARSVVVPTEVVRKQLFDRAGIRRYCHPPLGGQLSISSAESGRGAFGPSLSGGQAFATEC